MDVAGLSDERGTRSVAGHVSNGVRDRRGRRPRSSAVRPGPVNVRQPVARAESPTAAAATADRRQADYFRRVLVQNRRHIEHRLSEYQKAIATAEATGDAEGAASVRRMARLEEQERQTLDVMIEKLQRRFPPPNRAAAR
ncbi:hypothetical protein [Mycobacterium sp. 1245805.9]|uniref:hypothetical protein n=1 Tax=Mycobacterium sp. 1245805.9 TaxID=1856862 RepID=UPI0007FEFA27|nr:hypothetical protein [Mycobacterium sp. 1245805.9]OBI93080.1 hypothetical protein A9X00_14355 [Mycobacterium sp. 1245805.9]